MNCATPEEAGRGAAPPRGAQRPLKRAEAAARLAQHYHLLVAPGQVVELRAVGVRRGSGRPHVEAGFFDSDHLPQMAAAALDVTPHAKGVYFTLNPLNSDLLARRCNRIDWAEEGELAKDKDVLGRRWLLVDADPVRDALVSSTDAEKAVALDRARAVRDFLRARGWPDPLLADSGNGCHLLYRLDLPADDGGRVGRVLMALAERFDDGRVEIDRKVFFNPARVCKLPGTLARKGDSTATRPHRRASLLEVPPVMSELADAGVVPVGLLDALAAEAPAAEAPPPSSGRPKSAAPEGGYASRLLVDRWLAARNVAFRVKAQPDGKGRTVYVLKECPFDPSHGDPDACVMQDATGKMSAQCFHNSCGGRGWQAFKDKIGGPDADHYDPPLASGGKRAGRRRSPKSPGVGAGSADPPGGPPPPAAEGDGPRLPTIRGNLRQLRDVTADALAALLARNDPPAVFQRGGLLTRLRVREETGAPFLEPLTDPALRGVLARAADWQKARQTQEGVVVEEDAPPMEVVRDLAHLPRWDGVPVVEEVVECPVLARDGVRVTAPGFHAAARLWHQPAPGLVVPEVPARPSTAEVRRARDLLLVDLLGDFPFTDDAGRAHALAALLLPLVRRLVDGPTPLHLLDAPVEGTGKTLLANVIGLVSTGRPPEAMAEGSSDEEWRKRLTALLAEGPTFILLDNLNRVLDSGVLAAALTCRVWKDRLLGVSKTAAFPNTAVWLASGNNTRLSRELIRRTVWCRLDAKVDAPWERREFRHANLMAWAKANRGGLVGAALTLCQAWVAAGRPAGAQTLGMFEDWAEVVGGVLDVAGVPGLLANARDFRVSRADKAGEWRAFIASWRQEHGEREVGVDQLFTLALRDKLLDGVLGDKGERSQRIRLGLALSKAVDRVYGEYRMEGAGDDHKGRQQYRLRPGRGPAAGTASPAEDGVQEWTA